MTDRNYYDPTVDSTPLPRLEFITREDADTKARRAFVRGTIFGGCVIAALMLALPAFADTISISGTMVSLEPSQEPGVVAIVTMENVALNGSADNGSYVLVMPGMTVEAVFFWEADHMTGADRITIIPPDGMRCEPVNCEATVPEGLTGHIRLLEWIGS